MFSYRDMGDPRPPMVHFRMMIARDQFNALTREAARQGRGVSAAQVAKQFIQEGLARLEAERGRPTPPCNPLHQSCDD